MEKKNRSPEFWRYAGFLIILFGIFIWLVSGLISLQLKQSDELAEKADNTKTKTIALRGKRGNISTSDSVIMAEDELIYNVTFQKDATANTKELYHQYTASILETIGIVEKNGGEIAVSFVIQRNPDKPDEWIFNFGSGVSESVLETRERQWRSNNYLTNTDRYDTADKCIERLKDRYQITTDPPEENSNKIYVSEENMLKVMAIYSEMQMNIFNSQPIVIAKDVRYETVIEIETRSMTLPGMSIEIGTKRVYPRSNLASQIIGYPGAIPSRAMWLTLQAKG